MIDKKYVEWALRGERLQLVRQAAKTTLSTFVNVEQHGKRPDYPAVYAEPHTWCLNGFSQFLFWPDMHFLIQKEVFDRPSYETSLRRIGCIPVDLKKTPEADECNRKMVESCVDFMKKGESIGIYIEGPTADMIREDGTIIPIEERRHQPGAAKIALEYKAAVERDAESGLVLPRGYNSSLVPVGMYTPDDISAKLWTFPRVPKFVWELTKYGVRHGFRMPLIMNTGEPISLEGYDTKNTRDVFRLTKKVGTEMVRLSQEAREISMKRYGV